MLVLILSISGANAAVISFSHLSGTTDEPYSAYTEEGFTVTSVVGSWFQALRYGNLPPRIYDGPIGIPGIAAIQVTDTVLPFTFNSVDYSSNDGTSTFLIQGSRPLPLVFSD